jgi:MSHA pilin protein MshA
MNPAAASRDPRGFTLVELVIVILIIGILSALALPRFMNMGSDARAAKAEAILDAVQSGARVVRAAAVVHNAIGPVGTVQIDGVSISTVYGYPAASAANNGAGGIADAAGLDTSGGNSDQITLASASNSALLIELNGAPASGASKCAVSYTAPTAADQPPTIALVTSGC